MQSKTLNLNFTYEFDALNDPTKKEKTELVEKGVQKKVNNLNREEYCDFICCKILFGNVRVQLERFLTGAFKVLPKQYIANLKFGDVFETFYKTYPPIHSAPTSSSTTNSPSRASRSSASSSPRPTHPKQKPSRT